MGCDMLACSAYKFYGPHIGVLWGKRALLESLDVPRLDPAPAESPERLETGTQNHEGMVGAGAAVDFLAGISGARTGSRRARLAASFDILHARAERQVAQLWHGLGEIRGVTRYGTPPGSARTPTVSFTMAGVSPQDAAGALTERGIFASHGDFYALTVIERLGQQPDGVIRAGCACYTSDEEVERLVEGVARLAN
jgi:selenocysteine lyase/cysteine desulfurase